jgi:hypothetical protein
MSKNHYTWLFVPSEEHTQTDDEYVLLYKGMGTHVSIQCCDYAGGYGINSHERVNGKLVSMIDHGLEKSLQKAKKKAIEVYEKAHGKTETSS